MRPFDPRLLRFARSSRGFLALGAALGLVQAVALVATAWLVALGVTGAIAGRPLGELAWVVWALCGAVAVRAGATWAMDWAAARAGTLAKSELRRHVLAAVAAPRAGGGAAGSTAEVTTLVTHGLDALDTYFGKYLPQLLLTIVVTPLLLVVTLVADPVSGVTELVTLPVIPVFMALIGWATQRVQQRQLDALTRLAASFLEVVEGLSTLKIFGRARRQRDRVRAITDDYRRATMKVLRLSFLSGFALELFASLAVALVAVQIGIRLIDREMPLFVGLFVLVLAPEVFAPIRNVGTQFHAAAEGVAAAQRVFAIVEGAEAGADAGAGAEAAGATADVSAPAAVTAEAHQRTESDAAASGLEVRGLRVAYGAAGEHPVLDGLDAAFARGAVTAIAGPSGVGKSTLLAVLRGACAAPVVDGLVRLDGVPLPVGERAARQAWMGQQPGLVEGTVRDNVALGRPGSSDTDVRAALADAGLAELDPSTPLGVGGAGLSGGQSQRVALARAILRARMIDADVVLADEPSSALDERRERDVIAALRALADEGRVVVVVSHRRAVVEAADRIVTLQPLAVGEVPAR